MMKLIKNLKFLANLKNMIWNKSIAPIEMNIGL